MKLKKRVKISMLKCPKCGKLYASLSTINVNGSGEPVWHCYVCGFQTTNFKDFPEEWAKVWAFMCPNCGKYIEDTSENRSMLGVFREVTCTNCYLKNYHGFNTLAINGRHVLEIEKIKKKDLDASEMLGNDAYIFSVKTKRQLVLLRVLNIRAMLEYSPFRSLPVKRRKDCLSEQYVLLSKEKLIGYLSCVQRWEGNTPLLNQIYVVPSERHKGYAELLVKYFIDKSCDPNAKVLFVAESPNEKSINLLANKMKLGDKVKKVSLG